MSDRWLNEIAGIKGVESVLLVTTEGDIIEHKGKSFEVPILHRIARHLMRILAAHHLSGDDIREIELVWTGYRLLVLGTSAFSLIIFCSSIRALSLLRISLNVVAAHLFDDKKIMKKIKKYAAQSERLLKSSDLDQSQINLISKLQ